jgi:hypothetical protein
MRRIKMFKNLLVSILACTAITAFSMISVSAEAEKATDNSTESTTESSSDTKSDNKSSLEQILTKVLENEEKETDDSESSDVDYYDDDYYDTDGNATLINNQSIIYNSDEMQFISVTTKDGNVFYVLINYSDDDNIDNVYFLNKVTPQKGHSNPFKYSPCRQARAFVLSASPLSRNL